MDQGKSGDLAVAVGLGALSGVRSLAGLAWLGPRALRLLAAGEAVADKLPFVPARTEALPLVGRAAMGGLSGTIVGRGRPGSEIALFALAGAGAAVLATFGIHRLRILATRRLRVPDPVAGLAEDVLVYSAGRMLVRSRP